MTAKQGDHFADADKKKGSQFFQEKIGVTTSVSAPGDTNPSDATGCQHLSQWKWANFTVFSICL